MLSFHAFFAAASPRYYFLFFIFVGYNVAENTTGTRNENAVVSAVIMGQYTMQCGRVCHFATPFDDATLSLCFR